MKNDSLNKEHIDCVRHRSHWHKIYFQYDTYVWWNRRTNLSLCWIISPSVLIRFSPIGGFIVCCFYVKVNFLCSLSLLMEFLHLNRLLPQMFCGLFYDSQYSGYIVSNDRCLVNNELQTILKWPWPNEGTILLSA